MKANLTSLNDPKYQQLKDHVKASEHERHYIVDFVSVVDLRAQGKTNDEIAKIAAEYFDNSQPGEDWESVDEVWAQKHAIEDLRGGLDYGQTEYALQEDEAEKIWEEFVELFNKDRTFYTVSFGDQAHKWRSGILIVDSDKAGVLHIAQG